MYVKHNGPVEKRKRERERETRERENSFICTNKKHTQDGAQLLLGQTKIIEHAN